MNTIQEAAQFALDVQSACNLRAVLRSYTKALDVLWAEADLLKKGSDWVHRHPIAVLYATQVGHLTRVAVIADEACDWSKCTNICERLAAGEVVDLSEYPYEREQARSARNAAPQYSK